MSIEQELYEPEEIRRPPVRKLCKRCRVTNKDVAENRVVLSGLGTAHFGVTGGDTGCGFDATGDGWWWPL